jgi:putative component of membrane protein insertase Oxa1/YidC/SpoIIIJ protein YidD
VINVLKIFFCLAVCYTTNYTQTDWVKWEAEEVSFSVNQPPNKNAQPQSQELGSGIMKFIRNIYAFFISDLDGDNCPFYPSCSHFFVQAVGEAGLIKGSLMFADRFIRDLNFFKSLNSYPVHQSGKFFDPVGNYSLEPRRIKYIPSKNIID